MNDNKLNYTDTQIEEIYNMTFQGLTSHYRDTTLEENLIAKYNVGQILMEKGFVDLSFSAQGVAGDARYLVFSAHAKDMTPYIPNQDFKKFGVAILPRESFFKVIDIYKVGDKAQIALLHISEDSVDLFTKAISSVEEDIVVKARQSFDSKCTLDPLPEHIKKEWVERVQFPIGMSDKGEFFYP